MGEESDAELEAAALRGMLNALLAASFFIMFCAYGALWDGHSLIAVCLAIASVLLSRLNFWGDQ